jgi:hypothetical protein
MNKISKAEYRVDREVDRLFAESPPAYEELCTNPITGGHYLGGIDPVKLQKEQARRALLARAWFAINGPVNAQPLPLSDIEIEGRRYLQHGLRTGDHANNLLSHIVAGFAGTLQSLDWDFGSCPTFKDFARGVMAMEHNNEFGMSKFFHQFFQLDEILRLKKSYPPRHLDGLSPIYAFHWQPPNRHAATMVSYRRYLARIDGGNHRGMAN